MGVKWKKGIHDKGVLNAGKRQVKQIKMVW